ncbi:MAG: GNAT family N-acetyltransferase, partial [Methanocorpusculum sp.]|nr:GNAT family N-acetyltransferase [Methanocorpusculum sp.]
GEPVGGLCLMGEPVDGVAEIGYGLLPGMEKHGYMTEAVLCMGEWLAAHGVHTLRAGCEADNTASAAVLRRCGFSACGEEEGVQWYEREIR